MQLHSPLANLYLDWFFESFVICFCLRITTDTRQAPYRVTNKAIVCWFMLLLQNTDKVMATVRRKWYIVYEYICNAATLTPARKGDKKLLFSLFIYTSQHEFLLNNSHALRLSAKINIDNWWVRIPKARHLWDNWRLLNYFYRQKLLNKTRILIFVCLNIYIYWCNYW